MRIGLLHANLVRVDDVIDQTGVSIREFFTLACTDKTVAEQPSAKPRSQPAKAVDHPLVRGTQILPPHVIEQLVDHRFRDGQPPTQALPQPWLIDQTNIAREPQVNGALTDLTITDTQPPLPILSEVHRTHILKNPADVEYHRPDHHDKSDYATDRTLSGATIHAERWSVFGYR